MVEWLIGGAVVVGVAGLLGRRAVDRRAADVLARGLRDAEARIVERLGGAAHGSSARPCPTVWRSGTSS